MADRACLMTSVQSLSCVNNCAPNAVSHVNDRTFAVIDCRHVYWRMVKTRTTEIVGAENDRSGVHAGKAADN